MSFVSPLHPQMLDVFCPMHVVVDDTGHITHVGPTIRKLRPHDRWIGTRFLEVFRILRPRLVSSMDELGAVLGRKLHLEMRSAPRTSLKGIALRDERSSGYVVNLSFGISVLDAVREYALTSADFAATDLAIEMLYLVEAKSAAMAASRALNLQLQGAKIAAEEQAFTDTLTGLKNRRALDTILTRLLESSMPCAVMHVDLDYFKAVNDSLGHAAGDHVLLNVARALLDATRSADTVARVGGDEFTIILPGVTQRAALAATGERIIQELEKPVKYRDAECRISASIGTVIYHGRTEKAPEQLIEEADIALYASKHGGRGRQTFYTPDLRQSPLAVTPPKGR
jgi:diguanylate cyclase (GGDEF)-like protein